MSIFLLFICLLIEQNFCMSVWTSFEQHAQVSLYTNLNLSTISIYQFLGKLSYWLVARDFSLWYVIFSWIWFFHWMKGRNAKCLIRTKFYSENVFIWIQFIFRIFYCSLSCMERKALFFWVNDFIENIHE